MGGCLSSSSPKLIKTIRVVHLSGYVEDFDSPVLVSQIIGKLTSKQFVSTATQLMSTESNKSLKPETQLQLGHVYFLLPYSALQSEVSPLDFAFLVKRLSSMAKKSGRGRKASESTPATVSSAVNSSLNRSEPGKRSAGGGKAWKPVLDTIREKSFNRRSESDVMMQEKLERSAESKT